MLLGILMAMKNSIVVSVGDPLLHPEAMHIVAAAGQQVIDISDPAELRRIAVRCKAVVVDKHMAAELGGALGHPRVLFVAGDPGPIDWQRAFAVGASEGFVIPAQAPELLRAVGESAVVMQRSGRSIAILGASGGCGASTLAVALARELGNGAVLLDADPYSGGIDLLLGAEHLTGARWNDLSFSTGAVDGHDLQAALPQEKGVSFLTTARSKGSLEALSGAEVRVAIESLANCTVVVDASLRLPGWEEALSAVDCVAVVIPAELRAVSAAQHISAQVASLQGVRQVGIVRHRSWSGLSVAEVERLSGMDVVAEIPHATSLVKRSEMHGLSTCPGALKSAVRALTAEMGRG